MKGIDLEAGAAKTAEERFEEVVNRTKAEASGMSQDQYEFGQLGFAVEEE
jgi:hypothetical protein